MGRILQILLSSLVLLCVRPCRADVAATYNSAFDVPVTAGSFSASGATFSATLNFAPPAGTNLMVVKNTGPAFINGSFSNLAQGQVVTLSYGGINYRFIANYYGGSGNDLVLQWAQTRPVEWGANFSGQLGNGSTTDRTVPVDVLTTGVLAGKSVVLMAAGQYHSLALCSDGTLAAWGSNLEGQLGNGGTSATGRSGPVAVNTSGVLSGKTIVAVAAGGSHSLALCSDGTIAAWGDNSTGQLGNDSTVDSSVPVAVNTSGVLSGKTVVAVAAGYSHSLALCSDGTVATWGGSRVPVAVNTAGVLAGKTVVAVTAGASHSLVLCSDGTLAAWGNNSYGQLGDGSGTNSQEPVAVNTAGVLSGRTVVSVAAGVAHSLALCSDGTVAEWGANSNSGVPVAVKTAGVLADKKVVAVAAGFSHSLALCSDGTVAAWGTNSYGQLGNGSTVDSSVPVTVSSSPLGSGERYAAIFSGCFSLHNLGLIALPPLPAVTSLTVTNLTKTGATLNGTVNPEGSAATAQFEYGTTTSYGSSARVTLSPDDGLIAQNVSATVTGLIPGTTYHYRLTAINALGTVSTTDGTFTTSSDIAATYNSVSDVPVTASSFSASGATFGASLNFAPPTGTTLMVVKNAGLNFINGTFSNLAQGQVVTLKYGGVNYRFIANYYGGSGKDLVLQWAQTKPVGWGYNSEGQVGDNSTVNRFVPVDVLSTGVLAGRMVIAQTAGENHSLALCSDGTLAAWGDNDYGQLGNGSTIDSRVPIAVSTSGVLSGKSVVAVAAGWRHSLALCSDGTVAAWGYNGSGQLGNGNTTSSSVPVAINTAGVLSGKTVVAVAAGGFYSLALCSDGSVATWGDNISLPVAVSSSGVLSSKSVVAVAAGFSHSLALCSDGTVAAWGDNSTGQLGNNSTTDSSVPVAVSTAGVLSGKTVVAVAAGENHSLALCADGAVAAWGYNSLGQLGNSSTIDSSVPVAVNTAGVLADKKVVAVAAGFSHSLALCSDGTVAAWGGNSTGQLGNNSTTSSSVPVAVSITALGNGERYAAVFGGSSASHNLGLVASTPFPAVTSLAATNLTKTGITLNGTINPNGNATTAQFEYGITTSYGSSASVTLSPDDGLTAQNVSAVLTGLTSGATYHYRLTATNAIGTVSSVDGTFTTPIDVDATYNSATDVPVTASAVSAAGGTFSATLNFAPPAGTTLMVVKNTGTAFISGSFSNLAQGQVVTLSYGGINYRFVANYYGGSGNDLVLQWAQTRPVAWGNNSFGQLGNNSTKSRLEPVDVLAAGVLAGKTIIAMAGGSHSLALCSDGTLAAWGANFSGQLGNDSITGSSVPVAVNTAGVLAGKTVVAVAAGESHSLALCSDGTVAAWGENNSGQLGNNSTTDSRVPVAVNTAGVLSGKTVVAVAAGENHSLALCSDGTVAAWGRNSTGQLGNNSTADSSVPVAVSSSGVLSSKSVVAVAAGFSHSLALCSDGTVAAWGDNSTGQLGNNSTTDSSVPVAVSTAGVLSGKTVVAVAAGENHSLALCADGAVAAWGYNSLGQLGNSSTIDSSVPVAVNTAGVLADKKVVAVAAGFSHSLALCSDGTVAAWGGNSTGQLGNNSTTSSSVPVAVSITALGNGERYAAVFGGSSASHNLGLVASTPFPAVTSLAATNLTKTGITLNGTINPNGNATTAQFEYGITTSYGSSASVTLSPDDGLTAQNVSAVLTGLTSGATYHYRLTATNAIGTVSSVDGTFTTPIDVDATYNSATDVPVTASAVSAAGGTFSATLNFAPPAGTTLMVVKNTGTTFISGSFSNLAQGQVVTLSYGGINYRFVANYYGGSGNDLVLQWAQTRPVAWGNNLSGQLGNGGGAPRFVPVAVNTAGVLAGKTVIAASAGESHSLALCSDGTVAAWGGNSYGQLGNGGTFNSGPVAVRTSGVLSGKTVVAVAAGQNHSLALCSDGMVAAWGNNSFGQLGIGNTTGSNVPVSVNASGVLSGKTVVAVAAGENHSLALCSDGTVAAWGNNSFGQLGNNSTASSPVAVAVNTAGVLSGKTVVAVAAGKYHSLVLCSDGTIAAWGRNDSGQLGNNSTASATASSSVPVAVNTAGVLSGKTVVAVAAGFSHSLALCSDGTITAWGYNGSGQLGDNTLFDSNVPVAVNTAGVLSGKTVVAVAAGSLHSLALCSDGTIAAWGDNFYGQLGNNSRTDSMVPVAVNSSPLATGERYVAVFGGPDTNHGLGLVAFPPAPVMSTLAATDLSSGSAVLNGSVNAAGGSASVFFDYGLDSSYGSTVAGSPSPVTGSTGTAVSASLPGLTPGTTYHYRVRATSSGGSTSGADLTFTTPPDTTGPVGGTMTLAPGSAVESGAALTVSFAGWTDPSMPLTYSVLIDDVVVSAQGASATRSITAPGTAGTHTLKGRIYDAPGNFTEVSRSFTVITTLEEWRTYYFGSAQNAGNAADDADPDGDGASNLFEYVAGLDPVDPLSRFSVRVEMVAGQPGQKAISFGPLAAGRVYTVSYKTDLSEGTWTPLTYIATSDNATERTVTDLSAGNGQRFYRVEITRP